MSQRYRAQAAAAVMIFVSFLLVFVCLFVIAAVVMWWTKTLFSDAGLTQLDGLSSTLNLSSQPPSNYSFPTNEEDFRSAVSMLLFFL